ncbi:TonB-dependent receptor [Terriglobus roseus]|uniref:Carboxypeptidase regulatory-like domain-containing protein n=1 Tax=Terriglobus roseus TaxID=392734 RepID=A0A1H4SBC2_9BACT|nr:carboxypeptidase regulatory-like domain-containing protein [Terriglobus roseus]SEC41526.1 Carboxypeptidase regulatory-like domain-containing protein [Terriglobus roseus]
MRFGNRAVLAVGLSASLISGSVPLFAQIDQGSVTGLVRDANKALVNGATITLVNKETNLTLTRVTDKSGAYSFTPVKIGTYQLTVEAPGFAPQTQDNIRVSVSQVVGLNLNLSAGGASDAVTVTADTALQTEEASTGQTFTARVLNDIPLDGRNYVFAAQLTTGVAAPNQGFRQVAGAGDFASNGNRVSQNNFVLDGVDNNSNMQDFLNGATYAVRPPPDALAEFRVQSSDYSAELGRGTGAAINASIKAGTNSVHGSLWEYYRNDRMNALDYFATNKTAYHMNQFGATLGGPIWKDKIFVFADAEGTRISQYSPPTPNLTVPTALERTGDFSELLSPANTAGRGAISLYQPGGTATSIVGGTANAGADPRYLTCNGVRNVLCANQINAVAKAVLALYPLPNAANVHQAFNNYTAPATAITNDTTQYDLRVDYNFSAKDQMFARYSYSNNPISYAPPLGILDGGSFGSSGQNSNYAKSGVFSETHFFSPTLSNEFRAGYNWLHASYLGPNAANSGFAASLGLGGIPTGKNLGGLPQTNFGDSRSGNDAATQLGTTGYLPSDELQNVLQIIDNVNKQVGRHTVKAGINFQHVRFYGLQPPNGIGYQNFNGTYSENPADKVNVSGSGLADYLQDQMNNSGLSTVQPFTDLRWYYAAFLQDDWKVTPRFTLNMGVRWEYSQPIRELNNMQSNFIGNYANNNQGTGTLLIPSSQRSYPIAATLATTLAADHIAVQYTDNNYLVNPQRLNFAPRVGFNFLLEPKTVLRGGFGMFYGGLENIGLGLNLANNAPFFVNSSFVPTPNQCYNLNGSVNCPTNGQTLETGFGAAATSPAALAAASGIGQIYSQDQNAKSSYNEAYNLSLQHSLSNTMTMTVSYQGSKSRRLRMSYNANTYAGYVPSGANGQAYQPFYDFGIANVSNEGIASYDSLQAKIEKQFGAGLYFLGGYSWAHCLDDSFGPIGQAQQGGYRNPNLLGFRYDYGSCTQDVRSRVSLNAQYELPFGRGKKFAHDSKLLDEVIGGWKSSLVFQAQTGNPIFLTSSNQGSSYPYQIADPFSTGAPLGSGSTRSSLSPTQPQFNCAAKTRTISQWFNPCSFTNPPQVVSSGASASQNTINAANAGVIPSGPRGRVGVVGPGFNRVDMSLFKSFALPYRETALQLRVDGFNVLNTPSFSNPGTSLTGTSGQAITSTRFSGILPNARVLQVAARLSF